MSSKWTAADVPDQSGRVAIVTGANSGLGFDTAAVLADKGAHVVLAVRNLDKGNQAADRIKAKSPNAVIAVQELDLTSLDSVRKAADELRANNPRIDLLINNAGVMYVPTRETTNDGFEMQFGTNHLGHFALTGQLLDNILPVEGSRVVTVSSFGHRILARIHFDDLQLQHKYNRVEAYGQSKLANLLFTYELQRRIKLKGASTIAAAASSEELKKRVSESPASSAPSMISFARPRTPQSTFTPVCAMSRPAARCNDASSGPSSSISPAITIKRFRLPRPSAIVRTMFSNERGFEL